MGTHSLIYTPPNLDCSEEGFVFILELGNPIMGTVVTGQHLSVTNADNVKMIIQKAK